MNYLFESHGERAGDGQPLSVAQVALDRGQVADGEREPLGGERRPRQQRQRPQRRQQEHPHAAPHAVAFTTADKRHRPTQNIDLSFATIDAAAT